MAFGRKSLQRFLREVEIGYAGSTAFWEESYLFHRYLVMPANAGLPEFSFNIVVGAAANSEVKEDVLAGNKDSQLHGRLEDNSDLIRDGVLKVGGVPAIGD